MYTYQLVTIEEVSGINLIQKLTINGSCSFDKFCSEIKKEGNYVDELNQIHAYLLELGLDREIPSKKFKELARDKRDKIKDFELRTYNLRIYLIKGSLKTKIIVFAGKKANQKRDIAKMRKIKSDFVKEHSK